MIFQQTTANFPAEDSRLWVLKILIPPLSKFRNWGVLVPNFVGLF